MSDLRGVLWLHKQHQPDTPQRLDSQLLVVDVKEVLQGVPDLVAPFLLTDTALLHVYCMHVCVHRWGLKGRWGSGRSLLRSCDFLKVGRGDEAGFHCY